MARNTHQPSEKTIETILAEENEKFLSKKISEISPLPMIDLSDTSALRQLAQSKLVAIIQAGQPTTALVPAIKELLDRIDGKAPQSIAMTVKAEPVTKLSDEQLNRILAALPDPLIIPPMPKKLDGV